MAASFNSLMHTKFFTPAFNSAIFDGPLRIYFAQFHEALALKLYFLIKENSVALIEQLKTLSKQKGLNVFILMYPTRENFEMSFEGRVTSDYPIALDQHEGHIVIGVKEGIQENEFNYIYEALEVVVKEWEGRDNEKVMPLFQ